jgi:hypothetical protein
MKALSSKLSIVAGLQRGFGGSLLHYYVAWCAFMVGYLYSWVVRDRPADKGLFNRQAHAADVMTRNVWRHWFEARRL